VRQAQFRRLRADPFRFITRASAQAMINRKHEDFRRVSLGLRPISSQPHQRYAVAATGNSKRHALVGRKVRE